MHVFCIYDYVYIYIPCCFSTIRLPHCPHSVPGSAPARANEALRARDGGLKLGCVEKR